MMAFRIVVSYADGKTIPTGWLPWTVGDRIEIPAGTALARPGATMIDVEFRQHLRGEKIVAMAAPGSPVEGP